MPYKCTACDKSFRYKVSQRSHKCLMNPPGNVVRVADLETIQTPNFDMIPNINCSNNTKCIMSVDYNTGNINFIENKTPLAVYLENSNAEDLQQKDNSTKSPNATVVTSHTMKIESRF